MSIKLINDHHLTYDTFAEEVNVVKSGRKWVLTNLVGTEIDLKIQVKNLCVKYTPEKYDKITVELDSSAKEFFEMLQEKVGEIVEVENLVKSGTLGLKMNKDLKLLSLRSIQQGDFIDAVIKFNDVWQVKGKNYISLELLQFKKLDKAPKIEDINYFVDDD